jgi:hypothetical protein
VQVPGTAAPSTWITGGAVEFIVLLDLLGSVLIRTNLMHVASCCACAKGYTMVLTAVCLWYCWQGGCTVMHVHYAVVRLAGH